jgi:hypothetical protein
MNGFKIILFILVGCIIASSSFADIYEWTDQNGVKHYSNYAPPAESKVLMKTKEEPYDEAADRERMAAERQERLELTRLEIAQREAELEYREAEAERRIVEADHAVEEAMRQADFYRQEDETSSRIIYRGGGYRCLDDRWDCNYPIYDRWDYRKKHRPGYHNRLSRLTPYQRYLYVIKHYGSKENDIGRKYRDKTRYRQKMNYSSYKLDSRGKTNYRGNRTGSHSGRFKGRGYISRGRAGFGMRR